MVDKTLWIWVGILIALILSAVGVYLNEYDAKKICEGLEDCDYKQCMYKQNIKEYEEDYQICMQEAILKHIHYAEGYSDIGDK